jgi:hypothetical protein
MNTNAISGFLRFVWSNRVNKIALIGSFSIAAGFVVGLKLLPVPIPWPVPVILLVLPASIILTSIRLYRFHTEWTSICQEYGDKLDFRKNVKTYIKNFWPREKFSGSNSLYSSPLPIYDFDRADLLESEDLLIIYGQRGLHVGLFFYFHNTRPFAIKLIDKSDSSRIYTVKLISKLELADAKEYGIYRLYV